MGRCYEFGVEIHAGCEHAMVVTAEGGACECTTCGTTCPGRFAACAAVVASPGRVPPGAPPWALPGADLADAPPWAGSGTPASRLLAPDAPVSAAGRRAARPTPLSTAPLRPGGGNGTRGGANGTTPADPPGVAPVLEALEALREEIRAGDDQLLAVISEYAESQRRMGEAVALLSTRISRELAQIGTAVDRLAHTLGTIDDRLGKPATLRDLFGRKA